ncbi:MAG: HAD family hydrolase [Clostridia bacterium]|nr:HAD family hydrolase [Clostridia bacterium]
MAASKYKLIIWDWNGTLYADRDISLMTVNYILDKRGMPPITLEQYYSYVDTPITRFYEHLFDMSKVSFDDIGKDYYYAYGKYSESLTVSPEIAQLLNDLHRAGCV